METVKVLGLRELREALTKKVPAEMQGKVLQKALVAGARPVVEAAKRYAPKGDTGILKTSIHSEKDRTNSNGVMESRAIRVRSRRAGKRIRAGEQKRGKRYTDRNRGSGAPYWWYVEFGTRFQAGQRFMTRGFDTAKFAALDGIKKGLTAALIDAIRIARFHTPRR
jgi:HK97 gp10 family phage protein